MFTHENDFNPIINEAGQAWDVEPALIKAVIGAESQFVPSAYRAEPQIGDASYGLMQLLYGTAKLLGYTGATSGLYDPTTNIRLGTRFLADLIKTADKRGYSVDSAISAYNAGFSAERPGDGKRTTDGSSPFVNQAYVDRVVSYANYYSRAGAQQLETVTVLADRPVENVSLFDLLSFGIPLLALLVVSKRHR